jgi:AraC-like DNA-binding protein
VSSLNHSSGCGSGYAGDARPSPAIRPFTAAIRPICSRCGMGLCMARESHAVQPPTNTSALMHSMKAALWPEPEPMPDTPTAGQALSLMMYASGTEPCAGSVPSDHLELDSHWHFHDMHQLLFSFEGALRVESSRGRHLVPHQLAAWIPAGVAHKVSFRRVASGSVFLPANAIANAGDRVRTVLVSPLMREMLRESMRWPLGAEATPLRVAWFAAMTGLCAEWIENEADLLLPNCTDPRLQRALVITISKMGARFADICREAGMSERTLRRRLRAETGMTWEAYRQRSRLLRAVALLDDPNASITEIAAACGFENPSAFAKAFRLALGETPSAYRRRTI